MKVTVTVEVPEEVYEYMKQITTPGDTVENTIVDILTDALEASKA
jgi:hypothetical protein